MPICVKHGNSPRGSDAAGAVKNDAAIGSQGVDKREGAFEGTNSGDQQRVTLDAGDFCGA